MPTAAAKVVTTAIAVTGAIHLRFRSISNLLLEQHFERDKPAGRHLNSP
jgi:hypothetical protein